VIKYFRLTILVFLGVSLNLSGQGRAGGVDDVYFSMLSFNIESTKKTILREEPIPVILTLVNGTGKELKGEVDLSFSSDRVRIFVEKPDKSVTEVQLLSLIRGGMLGEIRQPLSQNARYERKEIIQYELEKTFFDPGQYRIWAEFCSKFCPDTPVMSVLSNSIFVAIAVPEGIDREAYEQIKTIPGISEQSDKNKLGSYTRALENFVSKYSKTPYGDYFLYQLALQYRAELKFEKARECFERVGRDFIFRDEIDKAIKEIDNKLLEVQKQ
jgi:hypothetical protein